MGQEPTFQPRMDLSRLRERRSSAGPLSSGAAAAAAVATAAVKGQPVAKCMLTLDGYSYVIGNLILPPKYCTIHFLFHNFLMEIEAQIDKFTRIKRHFFRKLFFAQYIFIL